MKASILLNYEIERDFDSIKDLKKYLNEALYYCEKLYLIIPRIGEPIDYKQTNDIASIVRDVRFYGDEYLCVVQSYELEEE